MCSARAEWGTKLKLVKQPPTTHCVSQLGSLLYPVREAQMELNILCLGMLKGDSQMVE